MTHGRPFELEFAEPHIDGPCPCCGGLTVRGTGFVTVDDAAYATYYVRYANNHPDRELALIVSIGDFSEGSDASARDAFYARLRPHDGSYALMLDDAADSPWGDVALLGRKLTREAALAHPLLKTVFALTDEIEGLDPRVRGFFGRAATWDEPEQFLALDVEGTLANDLGALELPAPRGIPVRMHARHADEALGISDSSHAPLRARRAEPWSRSAFETYAVARGYL